MGAAINLLITLPTLPPIPNSMYVSLKPNPDNTIEEFLFNSQSWPNFPTYLQNVLNLDLFKIDLIVFRDYQPREKNLDGYRFHHLAFLRASSIRSPMQTRSLFFSTEKGYDAGYYDRLRGR